MLAEADETEMQWQKGLKKLDAGTTPSEIFNALDELARLPPVSQPTTSASELVGGGQDLLTKVRDCSWPYNIEIEKPEHSQPEKARSVVGLELTVAVCALVQMREITLQIGRNCKQRCGKMWTVDFRNKFREVLLKLDVEKVRENCCC